MPVRARNRTRDARAGASRWRVRAGECRSEVRALLHLRQGKVQLVLRRRRQRRRVIENDLAAIVTLLETVGLGARRQQIAGALAGAEYSGPS